MKNLSFFIVISMLLLASRSVIAATVLYTFEGTVSGFSSYHQDYDINDFDLTIGQTSLKYTFVVDLQAEQSTYTNTAGTWYYFYSDLLEGSIINGGNVYGDYHGFDWYSLTVSNTGQISSNLANVRITTNANTTPDWQVNDWKVGQTFRSTDLACYAGGIDGCAVYAFGDVTLTSISSIPLPGAFIFFVSSIVGLGLTKQVRRTR